jgi:hypothetical protein
MTGGVGGGGLGGVSEPKAGRHGVEQEAEARGGGDHFLRDRGSPFCTVVWHEIYAAMLFASVTIQLYLPVMAAAQLG